MEIRFEDVWEQDCSVIVRREGDDLVIELVSKNNHAAPEELMYRVILHPTSIACDLENAEKALRIEREESTPWTKWHGDRLPGDHVR